jgi:predicted AAA+ superfamily ATPase
MYSRFINLPILKENFYLFGPRQTGKTTLILELIKNYAKLDINLLIREVFLKYKTDNSIFTREIDFLMKHKEKAIVFIDEIQKIPELLDEVHHLIEKYKNRLYFILTGSSARKLRRGSVNLLAGRAIQYYLYPLTHIELEDDFELHNILLTGSLPPIIGKDNDTAFKILDTYTNTYLKEEILDEAITRNIGVFSRFLNIAADQSGQIVNYSSIARDTHVSSKTIKEYYQILEDTLIAYKLEPYLTSTRKRLVMHPKYYLFDLGITNSLVGRREVIEATESYGRLFEHFIILEIIRLSTYKNKNLKLHHFRTSYGAEVDLIVELNNKIFAIEIKSKAQVVDKDLSGLKYFKSLYPEAKLICIANCDLAYSVNEIDIVPFRYIFKEQYLGLL